MAAMHEDVQQRTSQDEEERQIGDGRGDMRAVFCHEEISANRQKTDQRDINCRGKEAGLSGLMIIMVHGIIPHFTATLNLGRTACR